MERINEEVGKRIRKEQKKVELTLRELGKLAKIDYSFLGYIERSQKNLNSQNL